MSIVTGNFNGDSHLDIAVANMESGTVGILLGTDNESFQIQSTFSTGGFWPSAVAVGDFNSDGSTDLVVANS